MGEGSESLGSSCGTPSIVAFLGRGIGESIQIAPSGVSEPGPRTETRACVRDANGQGSRSEYPHPADHEEPGDARRRSEQDLLCVAALDDEEGVAGGIPLH